MSSKTSTRDVHIVLSNMKFLHFFAFLGGAESGFPIRIRIRWPNWIRIKDPVWIRIRNTDAKSIVLSRNDTILGEFKCITMLIFKFLWTDISAAADAAINTIREQTKLEETLFKDGIVVQ